MSRETTAVRNLPIFKNQHFDLEKVGDSLDNFRKGEKGWFNILKLVALVGVGYLTWIYILPPLFRALGQYIAIAGVLIAIVGTIFLIPTILKALRRFARWTHKAVIRHDPFGELEEQKQKMYKNKERFTNSRGTITNLQKNAENSAHDAEKAARNLEKKITRLQEDSEKLREKITNNLKAKGESYKTTDEYVHLYTELQKMAAEATRVMHQKDQEEDFVRKYGMRGATLKKFLHKLIMVDTALEIKIGDFETTIDILKRDYQFAQESRKATDAAKAAMFFDKSWELEYALDIVTETIAQDLAKTTSNLNDIDRLTASGNYNLDNDAVFEELDQLALEIGGGNTTIPEAKQYLNPDYIPTQEDRAADSSGFGELY